MKAARWSLVGGITALPMSYAGVFWLLGFDLALLPLGWAFTFAGALMLRIRFDHARDVLARSSQVRQETGCIHYDAAHLARALLLTSSLATVATLVQLIQLITSQDSPLILLGSLVPPVAATLVLALIWSRLADASVEEKEFEGTVPCSPERRQQVAAVCAFGVGILLLTYPNFAAFVALAPILLVAVPVVIIANAARGGSIHALGRTWMPGDLVFVIGLIAFVLGAVQVHLHIGQADQVGPFLAIALLGSAYALIGHMLLVPPRIMLRAGATAQWDWIALGFLSSVGSAILAFAILRRIMLPG